MDSTLYDFMSPLLKRYNSEYGTDIKSEDITNYNTGQFLNMSTSEFYTKYVDESLFEELEPYENFIKRINKWHDVYEYEIYFVTACRPETVPWRDKWLSKYFPWYDKHSLIVCHHKWLISGDILIDDCYDNCFKFRELHPMSLSLLLRQPWNEQIEDKEMWRMDVETLQCSRKE